jgi:hypothetical protein
MQPYVVKQGDYLAKLAYRFGFDAATVWMQDENSDLRALRCNPNILAPCDILYIPEPADPEAITLEVGQTNTFTSDPPTVQVVVQFNGTDADASIYSSQPFQIAELPELTELRTNENGVATIDVPVTLSSITLTFSNTGASQSILIADMDPINTLAGIFKRLQHLGFISQNSMADPSDLDVLRSALRMLKASVAAAADSAPSGGSASDDSPSSDGDPPSSDDGPPSSDGDPSSSDDGPPSSDGDPPSSDAGPPSSDDGDDSSAGSTSDDDAGLSDDGVLDDDTTKLLLDQHGS